MAVVRRYFRRQGRQGKALPVCALLVWAKVRGTTRDCSILHTTVREAVVQWGCNILHIVELQCSNLYYISVQYSVV